MVRRRRGAGHRGSHRSRADWAVLGHLLETDPDRNMTEMMRQAARADMGRMDRIRRCGLGQTGACGERSGPACRGAAACWRGARGGAAAPRAAAGGRAGRARRCRGGNSRSTVQSAISRALRRHPRHPGQVIGAADRPRPESPGRGTPIRFATALWRPSSANAPSVLNVNGFTLPRCPSAAATFLPISLPCRIACWAVGGQRAARPRRIGNGGDVAERPHVLVADDAHLRCARRSARRSSGSPSRAATGLALTPAVQHTVRHGITSPLDERHGPVGDRGDLRLEHASRRPACAAAAG